MQFAASLSRTPDTVSAVDSALAEVVDVLDGAPDVLLAFASRDHLERIEIVAKEVAAAAPIGGGCVAEGVLAGHLEADEGPGIAVWGAIMPGVTLEARHLIAVRSGKGVAITGSPDTSQSVGAIMLADPYSFPTVHYVQRLADRGVPVVGGLADTGRGPGGGALFLDGEVHRHGAIVVSVAGPVEFRTVVSQGCRPLGTSAIVTGAEGNELTSIAGKPAFEYVRDLFTSLDDEDRRLAMRGLHVGVVMDEYKNTFERGDFLIRAVVAVDDDTGSVTVGEKVPVGRTVQFQVRDPVSADDDLKAMLAGPPAEGGVLLFTCNGRGRRFFGEPDHDATAVEEALHPPAIAGFFAAGEIGPLGDGNYLHGYTASLVELRPSP
jgi:small ligand-binding sensory domain FIST